MSAAPKTTSLIVPGPVGDLAVLVDEPVDRESDTQAWGTVAVVCHPHPLFGGNMQNKVTHVLARTFNDLGAPAVRFNFRGVGKSAGAHNDGVGETEDGIAILNWAAAHWPGARVRLAGFSFGAAMALRASLKYPVDRLVTIAPALRWLNQIDNAPSCPWLIVQGDQDELVNAAEVVKWAGGLAKPPTIELLPGVDHFFHGRLNDLRTAVKRWLET